MDGIHRQLLQEAAHKGDVVGPFFGFMGAAAALVFACEFCAILEDVSYGVWKPASAQFVT